MEYRGLKLDRFQEEAIRHIEAGHSVLVAAPTGTGKTLIADYLIEHVLEGDGEIIYTAPVKALSNQKYRQYCKLYGRDKVGLITGDLVINRDAPIRIMTTEILRNMLLEGQAPPRDADEEKPWDVELESLSPKEKKAWLETASPADVTMPDLERLRAVIIDEIHFLDDPERGTVWEELLIYLPSEIRILGLSATLSNLDEFANWLSSIRKTTVRVVLEEQRTVPLELQLANRDTGLASLEHFNREFAHWKKAAQKEKGANVDDKKGRNEGSRRGGRHSGKQGGRERSKDSAERMTNHSDVIEMLPEKSFPALYFIYSRKFVELFATQLAGSRAGQRFSNWEKRFAIDERLEAFDKQFPNVLTRKLRQMYAQGIAFHHAGLHVALKALVEELYESRLLNVLYCTTTFAMGINMPARTVIFDSLTKFNGTEIVPLTVREFMQMAGRAGRRGIDTVGHIVVRQNFSDYEELQPLLKRLLSNKSEPVLSSFNLSFNSVVNLLDRFSEREIRFILEQSFKAYQSTRSAVVVRSQLERIEPVGDDDEDDANARERRRRRREVANLQRQLAEHERPMIWEAFQRKVSFLRTYGYVGDDNVLNTPARILRHIKIEEIFATELILSGVLEDRTPEELFGIMCGLVQTLPRQARVKKPGEKWWPIFEALHNVFDSDVVTDAEALIGLPTIFTPELMPLGERWARGEKLAPLLNDIQNPTDMSGDLVGAFRRAKDLIGQLRHVHHADEQRRRELTKLLRDVTRDEVEVLD
ncbi:MAG: DEAD/DEAH box helicase [Bradymonadaceae bacterium]|nr:DEAD/DEAH box helicase [Lujinxingiaceae bacterium]